MKAVTSPAGDQPDPSDWPAPTWGDEWSERTRPSALLELQALERYLEEGHPYREAIRSPNACRWLEWGQYALFVRIDDKDAFFRILDELRRTDRG